MVHFESKFGTIGSEAHITRLHRITGALVKLGHMSLSSKIKFSDGAPIKFCECPTHISYIHIQVISIWQKVKRIILYSKSKLAF